MGILYTTISSSQNPSAPIPIHCDSPPPINLSGAPSATDLLADHRSQHPLPTLPSRPRQRPPRRRHHPFRIPSPSPHFTDPPPSHQHHQPPPLRQPPSLTSRRRHQSLPASPSAPPLFLLSSSSTTTNNLHLPTGAFAPSRRPPLQLHSGGLPSQPPTPPLILNHFSSPLAEPGAPESPSCATRQQPLGTRPLRPPPTQAPPNAAHLPPPQPSPPAAVSPLPPLFLPLSTVPSATSHQAVPSTPSAGVPPHTP